MNKLKMLSHLLIFPALLFIVGFAFTGCGKEALKTVGNPEDARTVILKNESGMTLTELRLKIGEGDKAEEKTLQMTEGFAPDERRQIHLPETGNAKCALVVKTEENTERILHDFPPADMKEGAIRFENYENQSIAFLAYISEESKKDMTTRDAECKIADEVKKAAEEAAEKMKKEEAERQKKEEAERKEKEEAARKAKEEAERKADEAVSEDPGQPEAPVAPITPKAPVAPATPVAPAAPAAPTVNDNGCVNDAILN
ncbi:MAG: hypothetical protein Q4P30_02100 [Eubacteriales bacterium]|nr:hypothetical protein [Eubacteriales bacterium]